MYDVCAIGDILVDFTPMEPSPAGNYVYECNAGGTIANLCAAAGKMGLKTLFVGKIGNDDLGKAIKKSVEKCNVDMSGCSQDNEAFTTLTFVTLNNGERSFSFSRKNTADINLKLEDVPVEKVMDSKILHFSGMCLTNEPVRSTTLHLVKEAREKGIMITLDVNYRESLWSSSKEAVEVINDAITYVDIYKSSEEEICLLTGEDDISKAAEKILSKGVKMVIVSCGPKGAFYKYGDFSGHINTFDTKPVDTTGAGDCFMAAILYQITKYGGIESLTKKDLDSIINFANAAGAQSITKRGGVSSMPTIDEIEGCMKNVPKLVIS
ncbi:MAG: carbohydrate kinase family protein [Acetivibrionales bacterium]|jgi:fructokinase|nr:carbohydrate kinase [Clostridiaceae bacterium]